MNARRDDVGTAGSARSVRAARERGNAILAAARPLLVLGVRLRQTVSAADPGALRREAAEQVRRFEADATRRGVSERSIIIARHALCTYLDLAAFSTPWGKAANDWSSVPLVYEFFADYKGGEEFLKVLSRAIAEPAAYGDVLEIQYLCLLLGFDLPRVPGAPPLETLRADAARVVATQRTVPKELSPRWRGTTPTRSEGRGLPAWGIAFIGVGALALAWIGFEAALSDAATPLRHLLRGDVQTAAPLPAPLPVSPHTTRLRDLLADREHSGQLLIEVIGNATRVILSEGGLFDPGSDVVAPTHVALLKAVGDALEQVPGRVLVEGHTDDRPVNTSRFADNVELSRARAVAVADILKRQLSDPARVGWAGAGDSEPRYTPASDPANRSRNRRIEIVHFDSRSGP